MMSKKCVICSFLLAAATLLSACSSVFEKEYVSIKDYNPPEQEGPVDNGRVTVRNFTSLKQTILGFAYAGVGSGIIEFDASYDGDIAEDMASACWQVRTQDALCAYCVENIAYDINQIVTVKEASISISYSQYGVKAEDIQRTYYSSDIERIVKDAIAEGKHMLAVLVVSSTKSADEVSDIVKSVYRKNPIIAPAEPYAAVTMFSGTSKQRLYEINIDYGMSEEEKARRMAQLAGIAPFGDATADESELDRAYRACSYLANSCALSYAPGDNTAYAALIGASANSEGIAYACVELCHRLSLDCVIVYGQKSWEDHCWNIVKVDGSYYHVDVTEMIKGNFDGGFLLGDERMWGNYRWDVASYPKCQGELSYNAYLRGQENIPSN